MAILLPKKCFDKFGHETIVIEAGEKREENYGTKTLVHHGQTYRQILICKKCGASVDPYRLAYKS